MVLEMVNLKKHLCSWEQLLRQLELFYGEKTFVDCSEKVNSDYLHAIANSKLGECEFQRLKRDFHLSFLGASDMLFDELGGSQLDFCDYVYIVNNSSFDDGNGPYCVNSNDFRYFIAHFNGSGNGILFDGGDIIIFGNCVSGTPKMFLYHSESMFAIIDGKGPLETNNGAAGN